MVAASNSPPTRCETRVGGGCMIQRDLLFSAGLLCFRHAWKGVQVGVGQKARRGEFLHVVRVAGKIHIGHAVADVPGFLAIVVGQQGHVGALDGTVAHVGEFPAFDVGK
ncbi:hypothetical protein DESC_730052 [Desulfosarcina cetonica]|nr:hypothetical protein DESC_730052 [Desulfosarcina cetonica]